MSSSSTAVLALLATVSFLAPAQGASVASQSDAELRTNPIRKVVTMLQDMQKTVEAEGIKEEELFDKFMCYCSGGEGQLAASIEQGNSQIGWLTRMIKLGASQKSQLEQDLKTHRADRAAAEQTMSASTELRKKDAAAAAATIGDMKSNIGSMVAALEALKKGLSAALLQTGVGSTLRNIIAHSPAVRASQRGSLLAFLETGSGMEGGSDTIIGVVEQMKETMEADLAETEKSEAESKTTYETLMTSKKSEIEAAGKAIETKSARLGRWAWFRAWALGALAKTTDAVAEDTKFQANLKQSCATKQAEWDERCKIRAEEMKAISETIEMLNSDEALELFKKTLPPTAALIQTSVTTRSQMRRVQSLVQKATGLDKKHSVTRRLVLAALKSGTGGFEKVATMIDGMNEVLEGEQVQDDKLDAWCLSELDKAKQEANATEADVGDLAAAIDSQREAIETMSSEIQALQAGLAELDKDVAEATEQRKDEHAEYMDDAASNRAAVELLGMAKNRLNQFYNPAVYKETVPVAEKEEEEFFAQRRSNFMSDLHGGRAAPGPPPETFSGEYKGSGSSSGIINLIDEMVKDMEDDMAEAKRDEEEAQKDYEETMNDAATKRSKDSQLMVTKESEKAEETTKLEEFKESRRTKKGQLEVLEDMIDDLHKTCDNLVEHYATIKEARTQEVEALKTAKALLAGAHFFSMQRTR